MLEDDGDRRTMYARHGSENTGRHAADQQRWPGRAQVQTGYAQQDSTENQDRKNTGQIQAEKQVQARPRRSRSRPADLRVLSPGRCDRWRCARARPRRRTAQRRHTASALAPAPDRAIPAAGRRAVPCPCRSPPAMPTPPRRWQSRQGKLRLDSGSLTDLAVSWPARLIRVFIPSLVQPTCRSSIHWRHSRPCIARPAIPLPPCRRHAARRSKSAT